MESHGNGPPAKKPRSKPQPDNKSGNDTALEDSINRAINEGESCIYNAKFALYKNSQFNNYLVPFLANDLKMSPRDWANSKSVLEPSDMSFKWLWKDVTPEELQEFKKFSQEIIEQRNKKSF